jgi:hypothetical protein
MICINIRFRPFVHCVLTLLKAGEVVYNGQCHSAETGGGSVLKNLNTFARPRLQRHSFRSSFLHDSLLALAPALLPEVKYFRAGPGRHLIAQLETIILHAALVPRTDRRCKTHSSWTE